MKTTASPWLSTQQPSRDLSPLGRALAGVIAGSILVLLAHPLSRPFLSGLFNRGEAIQKIRQAGGAVTAQTLPNPPRTVSQAGLWMQLAAGRLQDGSSLDENEIISLRAVLLAIENGDVPGLSSERQNAFWYQMWAVIEHEAGNDELAKDMWIRASTRSHWQDYQASRLLTAVDGSKPGHRPMAWQVAAAYYEKSTACAEVIYKYALALMSNVDADSKSGIELRYATLRNGAYIRDYSRSMESLVVGHRIADLAALPDGSANEADAQRAVSKARGDFVELLNKTYSPNPEKELSLEAADAANQFREQDSKLALFPLEESRERAAALATSSIFTAGLAGVLLALALTGAAARLLGEVLSRYSGKESLLTWGPLTLLGIALCFWVFSFTLLPLAAIAVLAGTLYLAFTPRYERKRHSLKLGRGFNAAVGVVTALFIGCFSLFLFAVSAPFTALMPKLGDSALGIVSSSVMLGFCVLTLVMLMLIAPLFALTQRLATSIVLGLALQKFGRGLLLLGLAGTVLITPFTVYADVRIGQVLREAVSNEQMHSWVSG